MVRPMLRAARRMTGSRARSAPRPQPRPRRARSARGLRAKARSPALWHALHALLDIKMAVQRGAGLTIWRRFVRCRGLGGALQALLDNKTVVQPGRGLTGWYGCVRCRGRGGASEEEGAAGGLEGGAPEHQQALLSGRPCAPARPQAAALPRHHRLCAGGSV